MKFNSLYFEPYKDLFNYYNLIKIINPNFRLYYNKKTKLFCIINIFNNFEICKTFQSFSENILQDLRFSKIENLNQILKNIEENNNSANIKKLQNTNYFVENSIKETLILTKRSTKIKSNDINKIIGATKC